jgi:leader peptidase (prepilin peptidase)/N-methyltransferase
MTMMTANPTSAATVAGLTGGVAGLAAGAAARRLLARLRRGTRVRAPVCELAVGALWAVTGSLWGSGRLPTAWLPAVLGLGWLGVAAGLVDARHRRLPDTLVVPATCFAPLSLLPMGLGAVGRGLLSAVAAVLGYGLVHLLRPAALGLGDVKLAAPLGAVLGAASWSALAIAAVLAAVITGLVALLRLCLGRGPPPGVPPPPAVVSPPPAVVSPPPGEVPSPPGEVPSPPGEVPPRPAVVSPPPAVVPHGPSMLAAAWLLTLATAAGGG